MTTDDAKTRCAWAETDQDYISYHDTEWGVPLRDDQKLFEFLILDGAQAGLSWLTILKRRENYRRAFDNFDPKIMARYDDLKIKSLMGDAGIIRNRLKIESAVKNARAYLELQASTGAFGEYLWGFVDGAPIVNHWRTSAEVPAMTPVSEAMSKDLRKRGFSFVGPTICYAFMQAAGLVNDHLATCFRHAEVQTVH